jgi:hypothetical protein
LEVRMSSLDHACDAVDPVKINEKQCFGLSPQLRSRTL